MEYKFDKFYQEDIRVCKEEKNSILELPISINSNILQDLPPNVTFYLLGVLATERKNFKSGSVIISLDANYYLGKIDYELEIETTEKNIDLYKVFEQLRLADSAVSDGKYSRFIGQYRKFIIA